MAKTLLKSMGIKTKYSAFFSLRRHAISNLNVVVLIVVSNILFLKLCYGFIDFRVITVIIQYIYLFMFYVSV